MTGGGTERSRPFVTDGYSAPGGVGVALDDLSVRHLGIDIEDYGNTYPGEFVQDDCSDVESTASFETPDLFWLSPKCQAYSILPWANVSRYDWDETPKERYPTFEDPNVREVIGAVAPDHLADIRVLKGGVRLFPRLVPVVPTDVRPGEN